MRNVAKRFDIVVRYLIQEVAGHGLRFAHTAFFVDCAQFEKIVPVLSIVLG